MWRVVHIASGGTLGIEDAGALRAALAEAPDTGTALVRYEEARMAGFDRVRAFSLDLERASDAAEYAQRWAQFSHWMLTTAPVA